MDPSSKFITTLKSKMDTFRDQVLADTKDLLKEVEKIHENEKYEIKEKLKRLVDKMAWDQISERERWVKKLQDLVSRYAKAEGKWAQERQSPVKERENMLMEKQQIQDIEDKKEMGIDHSSLHLNSLNACVKMIL